MRAAFSGTDERQPAWAPLTYSTNPDLRSQAGSALAASREVDEEQQRQAQLARIRAEIADIAHYVATLRQLDPDGLAAERFSSPRTPSRQNLRPREPQDNFTLPPRTRPPEWPHQKQQGSGSRGHQIVERSHPRVRGGSVEAASLPAPARQQWPPLETGDDVVQSALLKTKAALKRTIPAQVPTKSKIAVKPKDAGKPVRRRGLVLAWKPALYAGPILALAGAAAIGIALLAKWPLLAYEPLTASRLFTDSGSASMEATLAKSGPPKAASMADQTSPTYPFEMPDTYGVYAVGEGHLTALEPLPIRVPDARVAISGAITKPAPAPATDGTLLFVVYHRELATNVPESASVRVFAKVMRASMFVGGKPKSIPVGDSWAVRGGSVELRIAPVAANKEMILIRPADPNFMLSPGRYVLMFRNQAYDFSVAGAVSDTAHCLERSDLQDGSVYSECRELPAQPSKS